jgi:hypothetical protein
MGIWPRTLVTGRDAPHSLTIESMPQLLQALKTITVLCVSAADPVRDEKLPRNPQNIMPLL